MYEIIQPDNWDEYIPEHFHRQVIQGKNNRSEARFKTYRIIDWDMDIKDSNGYLGYKLRFDRDLDPLQLSALYGFMEENNLVLFVDMDTMKGFSLTREKECISKCVSWIAKRFPGLKIVLQCISTKYAVDFIEDQHWNIGATISLNHLLWTLDDSIKKQALSFTPICKSPQDRYALECQARFNENDYRFFFGSHYTLNGDVVLAILADFFKIEGSVFNLESLERFISRNGATFLKLPYNKETIEFVKEPWTSKNPFDKELNWKIKPVSSE